MANQAKKKYSGSPGSVPRTRDSAMALKQEIMAQMPTHDISKPGPVQRLVTGGKENNTAKQAVTGTATKRKKRKTLSKEPSRIKGGSSKFYRGSNNSRKKVHVHKGGQSLTAQPPVGAKISRRYNIGWFDGEIIASGRKILARYPAGETEELSDDEAMVGAVAYKLKLRGAKLLGRPGVGTKIRKRYEEDGEGCWYNGEVTVQNDVESEVLFSDGEEETMSDNELMCCAAAHALHHFPERCPSIARLTKDWPKHSNNRLSKRPRQHEKGKKPKKAARKASFDYDSDSSVSVGRSRVVARQKSNKPEKGNTRDKISKKKGRRSSDGTQSQGSSVKQRKSTAKGKMKQVDDEDNFESDLDDSDHSGGGNAYNLEVSKRNGMRCATLLEDDSETETEAEDSGDEKPFTAFQNHRKMSVDTHCNLASGDEPSPAGKGKRGRHVAVLSDDSPRPQQQKSSQHSRDAPEAASAQIMTGQPDLNPSAEGEKETNREHTLEGASIVPNPTLPSTGSTTTCSFPEGTEHMIVSEADSKDSADDLDQGCSPEAKSSSQMIHNEGKDRPLDERKDPAIGDGIRKRWDVGWFNGKILDIQPRETRVRYSDGHEEGMSDGELEVAIGAHDLHVSRQQWLPSPGTRVAKRFDQGWYAGTYTGNTTKGKFRINFDDGDRELWKDEEELRVAALAYKLRHDDVEGQAR